MQSEETQLAVIASTVQQIKEDVTTIKADIKAEQAMQHERFVSRDEFLPVRNLVFGLVGLVMTSVVVALLALVVTQG